MKEVVNVTSDLFGSSCKNCKTAEGRGEYDIGRALTPTSDNPNPPEPSKAVATVKCFRSAGDISADVEIAFDDESYPSSSNTGPINCPLLEVEE